jgi:hypothetical protein
MAFLIALGQDVEITVRPTRKEHGQVSLVVPQASCIVASQAFLFSLAASENR